jgi:Flp pilus assembly protein CpaB
MVGVLSPSRAIRQSRRIDARVPISILVLLAAVAGAMAFFTANNDTRSVLVATHELPAGATLTASDVAIAHVRVDDSLYGAALHEQALTQLVGKQLAEPVHAQQMLVQAQISTRPVIGPNEAAMTIPVNPTTAIAGRVRAGDSVQVIATLNKGKPETKTAVVLPRVKVYDVAFDQRPTAINTGGSGSANAQQGQVSAVTLILSPEQAVQLSAARWNGDLDVVLLPPEQAVTSPVPQSSEAGHGE